MWNPEITWWFWQISCKLSLKMNSNGVGKQKRRRTFAVSTRYVHIKLEELELCVAINGAITVAKRLSFIFYSKFGLRYYIFRSRNLCSDSFRILFSFIPFNLIFVVVIVCISSYIYFTSTAPFISFSMEEENEEKRNPHSTYRKGKEEHREKRKGREVRERRRREEAVNTTRIKRELFTIWNKHTS